MFIDLMSVQNLRLMLHFTQTLPFYLNVVLSLSGYSLDEGYNGLLWSYIVPYILT